MIVIIKPVNAKVNLSRQSDENVTTRRCVERSHCVNIYNLDYLWTEVGCMKYEKS